MEVIKVYKESLPDVKLIGKCYANEDRDSSGTFATYWQQCFEENWMATFEQCKRIDAVSNDLVGAMRMIGDNGEFEYWIGSFFAKDAEAPEGFESVEISEGEIGICWIYGNDKNGELYGMEASNASMAALTEQGWKFSEQGWFFERYNNQRFTEPDEKGNVILDICAYLV